MNSGRASNSEDRGETPILRAGKKAWAALGIIAVLVLAWLTASRLASVVVPVVLALFVAAALIPVVDMLCRLRVPRPLAALTALVAALALVAGVVALVVPSFLAQLPELGSALGRATERLDAMLARLPFVGSNVDVRAIARQAATRFFGGGSLPAALGMVVTALASTVLLLVVVLFYLAEGRWLASALVGWLPASRQGEVWTLAVQLWQLIGRYFRALLVVALLDAVLIGVGLFLLDVPLALPLAVLVYFGAFLPYIGATVSGGIAVLVALAERGLITALIALGVVLAVQQLEGNVIQPLVMGKLIRLPAFVVLVAIAVGAALLGVLGAFLAVPVTVCVERVLEHVRARESSWQ